MKPITLRKSFEKAYVKRLRSEKKLTKQYKERVNLFLAGHRDQPLNDHALTGTMSGLRSFSISGDIRVIYRETASYYEFIDIGTHAQVYE